MSNELEDLKAKFAGKRVKFVGMYGETDGPVGKVWRVTKYGVWVTFEDGSRQQLHPDGLRVIN
jgi:hypothetical protein